MIHLADLLLKGQKMSSYLKSNLISRPRPRLILDKVCMKFHSTEGDSAQFLDKIELKQILERMCISQSKN